MGERGEIQVGSKNVCLLALTSDWRPGSLPLLVNDFWQQCGIHQSHGGYCLDNVYNHNDYNWQTRFLGQSCRYCKREYEWRKKQLEYKCCIKHRIPFLKGCSRCSDELRGPTITETIQTNIGPLSISMASNVAHFLNNVEKEQYILERVAPTAVRQAIFHRSVEDMKKHVNESCSACDKPISCDEWFCYCSLCPECYMQTPEEELEEIDRRMTELAIKAE